MFQDNFMVILQELPALFSGSERSQGNFWDHLCGDYIYITCLIWYLASFRWLKEQFKPKRRSLHSEFQNKASDWLTSQ